MQGIVVSANVAESVEQRACPGTARDGHRQHVDPDPRALHVHERLRDQRRIQGGIVCDGHGISPGLIARVDCLGDVATAGVASVEPPVVLEAVHPVLQKERQDTVGVLVDTEAVIGNESFRPARLSRHRTARAQDRRDLPVAPGFLHLFLADGQLRRFRQRGFWSDVPGSQHRFRLPPVRTQRRRATGPRPSACVSSGRELHDSVRSSRRIAGLGIVRRTPEPDGLFQRWLRSQDQPRAARVGGTDGDALGGESDPGLSIRGGTDDRDRPGISRSTFSTIKSRRRGIPPGPSNAPKAIPTRSTTPTSLRTTPTTARSRRAKRRDSSARR